VFVKDGQAFACGDNRKGEFGDLPGDSYTTPTMIGGGLGSVKNAAALTEGTILYTDNGVYASGKSSSGELGFTANMT